MSGVVLVIVCDALGRVVPESGQFLVSYDPDAHDGHGDMTVTPHPEQAQRFTDPAAAMREWKRPSTVRPVRPDGRPNRPLTAFTVATYALEEEP